MDPDALFVHIERDSTEVARSLVRRRQFLGFGRATAFHEAMNRRILEASGTMKNYVRLSMESLGDGLPALVEMAGLEPGQEALLRARRGIRLDPVRGWRADRSVLGNLWEAATNARAAVRGRNGKR